MAVRITADELRSLISYDPETGIFRWIIDHAKMHAGDIAGGVGAKGYWMIGINGSRYYGHRLAWLYMTGEWPADKVDHDDTDRINNRWANLREATAQQNAWNSKKPASNSSGFKGVSWNRKLDKWQTHIRIDGKSVYLGLFENPEDAHEAYVVAARKHHGKYARAA